MWMTYCEGQASAAAAIESREADHMTGKYPGYTYNILPAQLQQKMELFIAHQAH